MRKQTTLWTTLPDGVIELEGILYLQISVHVAPRLESDEGNTLDQFPDWLDWTQTLTGIESFDVIFDGGTPIKATLATPTVLRPDLWAAIFKPETFLRPFQFSDFRRRTVISYPTMRVLEYIKQRFQRLAYETTDLPVFREHGNSQGSGNPSEEVVRLIEDLSFDWDRQTALRVRDSLPRRRGGSDVEFTDEDNLFEDSELLSGIQAIPDPEPDFKRVKLFHYPPEKFQLTDEEERHLRDKPYTPLPSTAEDFEEYLDFHQAVASLGDYPVILRMLGLVFDLLVPVSEVSPNATFIRVMPNWMRPLDANDPIIYDNGAPTSPYTAFVRDDAQGIFYAKSRENAYGPAIVNGFVRLDDPNFELVQVDVDGAAIKLINFASSQHQIYLNNRGATDTPVQGGIPSLRSGGVSLNRIDRALDVYDHFNLTANNNARITTPNDIVLYAEDLLRGYRVDIWDTMTENWHSLCQRVGNYEFRDVGIALKELFDEGFAKMATTQQAPTEEGLVPASDDLYLHESLFTWMGWSLVAPRPGKSIVSDVPKEPLETPDNEPITPFKLVTAFKAARRSLPRLRFGAGYRMRVRVADVAGNSPFLDTHLPFTAIPSVEENPLIYLRYEPVNSPLVALREPVTESDPGESLLRLVIRTFNDDPSKDEVQTNDVNERHIAAPKSAQLMLEQHGVFDDASGQLRNDPATYNLIASRDLPVDPDNANTDSPVFPEEHLPVTYLPDPMAIGAALRNLPGTASGTVGALNVADALVYSAIPGIEVRPGSVTQIAYNPVEEELAPISTKGLIALYTFNDGGGSIVHDVSNVGDALDLTIANVNNVSWGAGALTINGGTIIASPGAAEKLHDAITASEEITLEAWITPQQAAQSYPARIMTLSKDIAQRDFVLLHGLWEENEEAVFAARLRTSATDDNALPSTAQTPMGIATTALTHLVFTRKASGAAAIYVNGVAVYNGLITGDLSSWDASFRFALANEFTGNRAWLGTYHMVAIYNRALSASDVHDHFEAGENIQPPVSLLDRVLQGKPFRVALAEHASGDFALPEWNGAERVLSVYLPKAERVTVPLSSYMDKGDFKLMGVWQWLREYIDELAQENALKPIELAFIARRVVDLVQYAKEGGHWMLTPSKPITLVHAVQQPIGHPLILELLAARAPRATNAEIVGKLRIHGKSTGKLDLIAHWNEPVDLLTETTWKTLTPQTQVAEIPIDPDTTGRLTQPGTFKSLGFYDKEDDTICFTTVGYDCGGGFPNLPAHPVHEFGDTKHRMVHYKVVAASRFREYFTGIASGFTRESEEMVVNVPSTERPATPEIHYVLPTYGWKRDTSTNLIASHRKGGGLRVYLGRPWFSSGEEEMLGVVCWLGQSPDDAKREEIKSFVTQWGIDPIWKSNNTGNLPAMPRRWHFNTRHFQYSDLLYKLPELEKKGAPNHENVEVAVHPVEYDEDRQLWYCDLEIDMNSVQGHYTPFIRLALVRVQPHSLEGKHLSKVILADFAQLAPDRSAILTYDPYQPNTLNLTVNGKSYSATANAQGNPSAGGSFFQVSVQQRHPQIEGDLGWMPSGVTVVAQQSTTDIVLWRGRIQLPADRRPGEYRIVISEYERLLGRRHAQNLTLRPRRPNRRPVNQLVRRARLVYVDTIEV